MKEKLSVLLLLLLLAHVPGVEAVELSYDVSIDLAINDVHEKVELSVENTGIDPLKDFFYELPGDAFNIKVYDSEGDIPFELLAIDEIIIESTFRNPILVGEVGLVFIEFDTFELVSSADDEVIFSALFSPPPGNTREFVLRVTLPRGMGLPNPISSGSRTDIVPIPDRTESDGSRTTFIWNMVEPGDIAVFVRYSPLAEKLTPFPPVITDTPDTGEKNSSRIVLFIAFVILILITLSYWANKLRNKESPIKKDEKTEFMKEDEKLIIDIIQENEGIVQKRIGDRTGFSKAKVSKIVKDLEKRNIIYIEKIGRRNKLFLTEEFKKV